MTIEPIVFLRIGWEPGRALPTISRGGSGLHLATDSKANSHVEGQVLSHRTLYHFTIFFILLSATQNSRAKDGVCVLFFNVNVQ